MQTLDPIPANPSDEACIDLVNSSFTDHLGAGPSLDRLAMPQWQQWFLDRYALHPEEADAWPIQDMTALRRDLRRILDKWGAQTPLNQRDVRLLDQRLRAAPQRDRVAAAATTLELRREPLRRDWTWVMAELSRSAVRLIESGDHRRLKRCENPHCSWMFYDTTINRSKQFCSTTPCGLLVRVRRFRQRGAHADGHRTGTPR